mgnify:CR=1 FL=1
MPKILIIGSNSNIAKNVINFLLKKKDISRVYGIDIQNKSQIKNRKFIYKKIKLSHNKNIGQLIIDKAISIALIFSFNLDYKNKNKYSYFSQGKNIVNNSIKIMDFNGINKVIYFSSLAVYGNQNKILTEKTKLNANTNYGKLKIISEKIISKKSRKKYNFLIFRLSQIYGKKINSSWVNKFFLFSQKKKIIKIYGDGNQKRDLLHIKDLKNLIYKSLNFSNNNIFNVCSEKAYSLNYVIKKFKARYRYYDFLNPKLEVKNIISKNTKVKNYFNWKISVNFNKSALKFD